METQPQSNPYGAAVIKVLFVVSGVLVGVVLGFLVGIFTGLIPICGGP